MEKLLTFEQLSEWLGYKRPSEVKKHLEELNVKFLLDRDKRPITTIDAINSTLSTEDKNDWEKGFM